MKMLREIIESLGLASPANLNLDLKKRAYEQGMAGRFENPYAKDSPEWKSWRDGLREAESDTAMCI